MDVISLRSPQVAHGLDLLALVVPKFPHLHQLTIDVVQVHQDGIMGQCQVLVTPSLEQYAITGVEIPATGRIQFKLLIAIHTTFIMLLDHLCVVYVTALFNKSKTYSK